MVREFNRVMEFAARVRQSPDCWLSLCQTMIRTGEHLTVMMGMMFRRQVQLMEDGGKIPYDQQSNTENYDSATPIL
jgi:hypothetical protein